MITKLRERWKSVLLFFVYLIIVAALTRILFLVSQECLHCEQTALILSGTGYGDEGFGSVWQQLVHRVQVQPFNFVSLILFCCAIIHTFVAPKIHQLSEKMRQRNVEKGLDVVDTFPVEIMRFMGEIEVIFGIWVMPLLLAMTFYYNWNVALNYVSGLEYTEAAFVVVIMAVASSRPIVHLAEQCMKFIARLGGETVHIWWWSILTIGPLSGSLITEPGAMTISALLLGKQFYKYKPSSKLAYATLGLLFVNVSVGGVFTSFAAPPVLMVSKAWGWSTSFMFMNFGVKAVLGILISNILYFFFFRGELNSLEKKRRATLEQEGNLEHKNQGIPFWISLVHIVFLAWIVVHSHFPVMFIGSFLIFVGFHRATLYYQNNLTLKTPILVGFFLAGLVVHGSLQAWWITPILGNLSCEMLMTMSTILTAFNDNAEITFLASLIPTFDAAMKYAVVAGAVTGGGLTVIANAPNPLGQALLGKFFPEGIRPSSLFFAALIPTIIVGMSFWLLRSYSCG
ncbi:MAG: putative Na+/H+ antiporter [Chlamydiota bacterium]